MRLSDVILDGYQSRPKRSWLERVSIGTVVVEREERAVIVCSCNVLSDGQVRCAIATAVSSARISHVYASLGCAAKCGRCAHTIKIILEDTFAPLAKESVS